MLNRFKFIYNVIASILNSDKLVWIMTSKVRWAQARFIQDRSCLKKAKITKRLIGSRNYLLIFIISKINILIKYRSVYRYAVTIVYFKDVPLFFLVDEKIFLIISSSFNRRVISVLVCSRNIILLSKYFSFSFFLLYLDR